MNQKERWCARGVLNLLGKIPEVLGTGVIFKKKMAGFLFFVFFFTIEGEIQRSS